jgi:hypothetical protein
MNQLIRAGACAALALSLAACNSDDAFKSACALKDTAYADWQAYAPLGGVSEKTQATVTGAYNSATAVCLNPPKDTASALITVASVGVQVAIARKAAQQAAKASGKPLPVSLRRLVTLSERH